MQTKKLLHLGVRNKYCSVCAHSAKHNTEPPQHDCYRNWDGPSSSMETDILVQGFIEAERKYGLRYTTFTGDGDSSVHVSLITGVPGWGACYPQDGVCKPCHQMLSWRTGKACGREASLQGKGKADRGHAKASDNCCMLCHQNEEYRVKR